LGYRGWHVEVSVLAAYAVTLCFGCAYDLLRFMHRTQLRHYLITGTVMGAGVCLLFGEILPTLGAYQDGRIALGYALVSSIAKDIVAHPQGIIFGVASGLASASIFWLIARPTNERC